MPELQFDEKAVASLTLGDVVRQTAKNYPDVRFRPDIYQTSPHYTFAGINAHNFPIWLTADGIGTKPELAERLYEDSLVEGNPTPEVFESLAFDTLAMIDGDEARFGRYMVGAANVIDMNNAKNVEVISALAGGLKRACNEGHFALINGETAELGYRTSGAGRNRLNWNAVGVSVFNPAKLILGDDLKPGQPIIALREQSIRSNGLSKARAILEADYLLRQGLKSKSEYVLRELTDRGVILGDNDIEGLLASIFGHDAFEQVLPPWHRENPEVTKQLLTPSRLYGPAMYLAQGRIDEPKQVELTAAAHITGGGIPEKTRRMVERAGLGVSLDAVFPQPEAVTSLMAIANTFPNDVREKIQIDDRTACEQWNGGIGFLAVAANDSEANKYVNILEDEGFEAAVAGRVIDKPEIQFRGHTWTY